MSATGQTRSRRSPRLVALERMRAMKAVLTGLIRPLAEPRTELVRVPGQLVQGTRRVLRPGPDGGWADEPYEYVSVDWARRRRNPDELAENSADYWDGVWRAAQDLRAQADLLARVAAEQARLARVYHHPANRPTPEESPE